MSSPREIPSLHSIDSKPINQSLESPSQSSELVSQFQVSDPFSRGSLAQRNVVCYEVQNMDQRFPLSTWEKSSCATDVMATDVMAMMCYPLIRRVSSIEATEPPVTPFVSLPNPDATMCAFTASIQVWYQLREFFDRILKQSCFETEMVRIKCPATFSLRSIIWAMRCHQGSVCPGRFLELQLGPSVAGGRIEKQ